MFNLLWEVIQLVFISPMWLFPSFEIEFPQLLLPHFRQHYLLMPLCWHQTQWSQPMVIININIWGYVCWRRISFGSKGNMNPRASPLSSLFVVTNNSSLFFSRVHSHQQEPHDMKLMFNFSWFCVKICTNVIYLFLWKCL